MPFTPAHVAAVLPLLRRPWPRLSATGLVVGSVVPDFEKFLRMGLHNGHSHTWPSLLYFSLPVGVGVAFLFHGVVRDPLLAHLPAPLRQRLGALPRVAWPAYFRRHYPAVLGSLLLAAATHLIWDAATHEGGFRGLSYPTLGQTLPGLPAGLAPLAGYTVADLLSTAGGLAALGWYAARQPRRPVAAVPRRALLRYWLLVGGGAGLLLGLRAGLAPAALNFWNLLISAVAATLGGVVVASWLTTSWRRPGAQPSVSGSDR